MPEAVAYIAPMHPMIPRRPMFCHSRKERARMFVLGVAELYDGLIAVLSLGYLTTEVRSWLLFSVFEVFEDE